MKISFTQIFEHSDVLNPISPTSLVIAGKLAGLKPKSVVLDLGCGKGLPSLLWAAAFGCRVQGFDLNWDFAEYAGSRARMLDLLDKVRYTWDDIRRLRLTRKYDAVAFLGLGLAQTYGDRDAAMKTFRSVLREGGSLLLAEPAWLKKPVPLDALKSLSEVEESFLTETEMVALLEKYDFEVVGKLVSSKEDWELYVLPVYTSMQRIIDSEDELSEEAEKVIDRFKAEYDAADKYWNMILWVARSQR